MRLIVMGQQAFGKDCLAKILEAGTDEVVAVYCEPDKDGKPVDPIKEFALEQGIPVHQPKNFKLFIGVDAHVAVITQEYLVIYYWGAVLWIQCNNIKMQLRVQRIVWPSLVGSIICLASYFALMEGLGAIYGASFQLIAVVNTVCFVI